jgi:cytochrome d ubiquinol oxidase subunit I
MDEALLLHRLQFAFTITFHYIFPQLTMGLSLLIVVMKGMSLYYKDHIYSKAARFWAKIFAINFVMGVVTGIPMEFQFGTNWAQFSIFAGGIIGNTLALEGMFAFFLESSFLGLFLYGEKKIGQWGHFFAALMVFLGTWTSGLFIVATNAFMQHPVAYQVAADGNLQLASLAGLMQNPWAIWQYLHTMMGALITGSFVVSAVGAYYVLAKKHARYGEIFLKIGVSVGFLACVLLVMPAGDQQAKNVAKYQPATFAAMEGLFETEKGAELVLLGQPNMKTLSIDNPIKIPKILSFMLYSNLDSEVKGLKDFPKESWPTNVPLLYYAYHIMAGLGSLFILLMGWSLFLLCRKKLFTSPRTLWALLLAFPFPYIANTAGWITAEAGRQPWLIYGLMKTSDGASKTVSSGSTLFTLLGFLGIYIVLGLLFVLLVVHDIHKGPEEKSSH